MKKIITYLSKTDLSIESNTEFQIKTEELSSLVTR